MPCPHTFQQDFINTLHCKDHLRQRESSRNSYCLYHKVLNQQNYTTTLQTHLLLDSNVSCQWKWPWVDLGVLHNVHGHDCFMHNHPHTSSGNNTQTWDEQTERHIDIRSKFASWTSMCLERTQQCSRFCMASIFCMLPKQHLLISQRST